MFTMNLSQILMVFWQLKMYMTHLKNVRLFSICQIAVYLCKFWLLLHDSISLLLNLKKSLRFRRLLFGSEWSLYFLRQSWVLANFLLISPRFSPNIFLEPKKVFSTGALTYVSRPIFTNFEELYFLNRIFVITDMKISSVFGRSSKDVDGSF